MPRSSRPLRLRQAVLADTSVWIHHLRAGNSKLLSLLSDNRLAMHPMVIGELACGNLQERAGALLTLQEIRGTPVAENAEVLHLIEARHLWGRGVGWVDFHLVAACKLWGPSLWTRDKRLAAVAAEVLGEEKVWR